MSDFYAFIAFYLPSIRFCTASFTLLSPYSASIPSPCPLARYKHADCHPVTTPMMPGSRLSKAMSPQNASEREYMQKVPYGSAVGSLLYIATATRPDIAYTVSNLCRFISDPGPQHWRAVQHLFKYLQGTKDLKLVYRPNGDSELFTTFTDSDHAGNVDSSRSTGGYLVRIGSGAVSWSSRLQTLVAQSTTEAEYIAAVELARRSSGCATCSLSLVTQSRVLRSCTRTISRLSTSRRILSIMDA